MGCLGPENHPGTGFVVLTDLNDYRLGLTGKMGAAIALNVSNAGCSVPTAGRHGSCPSPR